MRPTSTTLTRTKSISSRKKSKGFDLKPYMIGLGLILLFLTIYVRFHMQTSGRRLIPISVLALIAGVIFESRRLADEWKTVLNIALGSYIFSFFAFIPGKHERGYDLESHIEIWPYTFIFFFIILSISFNKDKITPKLTEGITLLLSIAAIYWVIDYGFMDTNSVFLESLIIIGLLFSLYSIFHAFTRTVLSKTSRLTLSIWSSIIMMLFAVDNIYRVYQNEQIENTTGLTSGLYVGLQFFLLGVSSIYIAQNFLMIISFLPGKRTFFNDQYFEDLKELKNDHIKRYSDKQISILHSTFCVLFSGTFFSLNHYFQILPRHLAIWTVFVIFPFIIFLYDYIYERKNNS